MASPSGDKLNISWAPEFSAYPLVEQPAWSVCTIKAPFYEPSSRAPVDIVAVIDKSGSMHGEKLDLVKETLEFVIDQCKHNKISCIHLSLPCIHFIFTVKECDRLSVVTYDTKVQVDFPLTSMDSANKERTKLMVKAIRDGSSTNLCGGLLKGNSFNH